MYDNSHLLIFECIESEADGRIKKIHARTNNVDKVREFLWYHKPVLFTSIVCLVTYVDNHGNVELSPVAYSL